MVEPVGVGVIGLGQWGAVHVAAYQALPHARVVAVADTAAARARRIADEHGVPRYYTGWQELIADPAVQAVSVVTPETLHRAPAVAAADHGKHVLVEKPLAATLADAAAIIHAAGRAGVILMPGHLLRFAAPYALIHQRIAAGELGNIQALYARRNRARLAHRHYLRAHPALVNTIHDIDVAMWLIGEPVRRVRAWHRHTQGLANPDAVWAVLEFANGAIASLESLWLLPDGAVREADDQLDVVGTKGSAHFSLPASQVSMHTPSRSDAPDTLYAPEVHDGIGSALCDELSHFARCVQLKTPPTVITPGDAYEALRVALAIVESATMERDVTIESPAIK